MFEINSDAQQIVVSALNFLYPDDHKLILCHPPGELQSSGCCSLGTHDLFRELLTDKRDNFISAFPNIHSVVNTIQRYETQGFSFEVVLACHEHCDLIGLIAELIEKFAGSHKFISRVRSLCKLPEKTLKPYAALTYVVGLSSNRGDHFDIQWDWTLKKSDDLSIPKAMYALDAVQELLGKKKGPLSSFRSGRNGCADYDDTKNCKAISFDAYKRSHSLYHREFNHSIQVLFQEATNIPLAVVQVKKAINWDWIHKGNQIGFTMFCLKHLDYAEQSQFACFLTQHKICFYFPKRNVRVDLHDIDSNILVRLMNYAEVPIPTSNKQGAFSITLQGDSLMQTNGSQRIECRVGRIGAIATIPVHVRLEEVESLICGSLERSKVARELFSLYRGYNFLEVKCVDEEGNNCDMIQCLVPQSFEHVFPCQCTVEEVSFTIDHALPYALPLSVPSRPPAEESRHDHWNKAACSKQSQKNVGTTKLLPKKDVLVQ